MLFLEYFFQAIVSNSSYCPGIITNSWYVSFFIPFTLFFPTNTNFIWHNVVMVFSDDLSAVVVECFGQFWFLVRFQSCREFIPLGSTLIWNCFYSCSCRRGHFRFHAGVYVTASTILERFKTLNFQSDKFVSGRK